MSVTFAPLNQTSPEVGLSMPAISFIKVVLPDSVVPNRMLKPRSARTRSVS